MTIITLTTDFGLVDGYVGVLKGVILGIAPAVQLVDLSHDVRPQDVGQAAEILRRSAPYFPAGTVHLGVVDPGVGSRRRALAVQAEGAWYVGPDNGLFTAALERPGAQAYELTEPAFWRPQISHTFHGRDIFAPAAAHLAAGVPIERMSRPVSDAVRLGAPPALAAPWRDADGVLHGAVVYRDRFGNLITNLPGAWLAGRRWVASIQGHEIAGPVESYAAAAPGQLLILISSGDTLEIAVRDDSAADALSAGVGTAITLRAAG